MIDKIVHFNRTNIEYILLIIASVIVIIFSVIFAYINHKKQK